MTLEGRLLRRLRDWQKQLNELAAAEYETDVELSMQAAEYERLRKCIADLAIGFPRLDSPARTEFTHSEQESE